MHALKPTLAVFALFGTAGIASAAIEYDQNVAPNVIFGSGNANGSYTTDRNTDYDLELGLRGKLRHNASGQAENTFNSNGDGTYTFQAGVAPTQSYPTSVWSFEWSINSNYTGAAGGGNVTTLTYELGLDTDPSAGATYSTFDPIHTPHPTNPGGWWDHSFGNNFTGNGQGVEASDAATYGSHIDNYNVAQNSWKASWYIPGFNPNAVGSYDIYLAAFDGATEVGRTAIRINVVPEPASLALIATGAGVALIRRRRSA